MGIECWWKDNVNEKNTEILFDIEWKLGYLEYTFLLQDFTPHSHSHKNHDDVIKWKHFPRYWPIVRGIHRSPVTKASDAGI